jgi:DNA-binding transcriptional LysR family regulator
MPRTFDPVTLRLFIAVCEERNIARAAGREATVPSTIRRRIAALEPELDVALLRRGRRGIAPTPAGEALLHRARVVARCRRGARRRSLAAKDDAGRLAQVPRRRVACQRQRCASDLADEVALAEFDTCVAQDVVSGGRVEEEVR